MKRQIITSCGMSLKSALCWLPLSDPTHTGAIPLAKTLRFREGENRDNTLDELWRKKHELAEPVQAWLDELWRKSARERAERVVSDFDLTAWDAPRRKHLSAELVELKLLHDTLLAQGEEGLGPADRVTIVYNQATPETADALAAILDAWGGHFFGDEQGGPQLDPHPVRGLDAEKPEEYQRGVRALLEYLDNAPDDEERVYGLTGGYKATVAVLAMASLLDQQRGTQRGAAQGAGPGGSGERRVRACYVHLEGEGLVWLELNRGSRLDMASLLSAILVRPRW